MCGPTNNSNLPNEAPVTVTGGGDATAAKQDEIKAVLAEFANNLTDSYAVNLVSLKNSIDFLGSFQTFDLGSVIAEINNMAGGNTLGDLNAMLGTLHEDIMLTNNKLQTLIDMLSGGEARVVITDTSGNIAEVDNARRALRVVIPS